jgi:beta-lactam-binding protein with PASTA domain
VTLVVSKGPPGVKMPDVVGLAAADATRALQERKLSPTLQQVAASEAPGTVVAQDPKAGARAKPGTKVVLQVAKGSVAVTVPDVVGQQQQQAQSALEAAKLHATTVLVPSSQPQGTVVAQRPAAGQKAPQGSAVRLNVARAATTTAAATTAATTTTPTATTTTRPPAHGNDYTGMRLAQAVEKIGEGRQQTIVTYVTSTQPAGVVVSNSRSGSREQLQVSAGAHPKPARQVPDVTGEDAPTAEHDLQAAGFTVLQMQWPVSDASQDGTVVYETPSGAQQAPGGAAIVIYVGNANG